MKTGITYTEVPWDLLALCLSDGWELETFNETRQQALIYKIGEHELDAEGMPAVIGKPDKPRPPIVQPPMRRE